MNVIQGVGTKLMSVFDNLLLGPDLSRSGGGGIAPTTSFHANERRHSPGDGFNDPDSAARRAMTDKIYADRLHLLEPIVSTTAADGLDDGGYQLVSHPPKVR